MFRPATVVACLCVTLAAAADGWAQTALTVLSREGRRTVPVTVIGNQDYVAVDDLAGPFGTTAREAAGGLTVTARGRTIIVTADQNVVSAAGRLVSLPAASLKRDNRWLVPVDFLPRALAVVLETRLDWRRVSRLLVVGDLRVPRVVTRVESGASGTSITFEISPVTPAKVSAESGRLLVQFDADALDLLVPTLPQQPFLAGIAVADPGTTVAVTLGPRYGAFRSSSSQPDASSTRLTLNLLPGATDLAGAAAGVTPPAPPPVDLRASLPPSPATGVRTVVIDPGHGGDELGAQGPRGSLEKEITLAVARRLRTLIESRLGMRVFLTREDDRTISHDDRSAFANSQRADLFLSIHANAAVRPAIKGAEVYYLSVERADAEARKRADDAAVALPALGGGTRAIDLILWETAQARYLEQSAALATAIEESLRARVEMSPRAVQQAPFRVLVGANMPSALVEIGYVSNPEQEQQLGSADYQNRVAEALLDAIVKFRAQLERTAAVMLRRLLVGAAVLVAAGAFGWLVMSALGRLLRTPAAPPTEVTAEMPSVATPQATGQATGPRIKATLFFASGDGQRLVGVEQDVPLAEGTVAQARALVSALLATSPGAPLASAIPEGTVLRGVYVSDQQEVFVDLDATVRSNHRGGSMQELLTVYSLVNTLSVNLPTIAAVQILIDGREADTLAGHVDLRRPLRKNEALIATPEPPQSPS